ncbi:MAG: hypothetical protein ABIP55_00905 [Tepidisphaeraceae bacterium]
MMVSLPLLHDPPPGEGCGTCTACCDVIGVEEVGKPPYARCPHLMTGDAGAGCRVYEARPNQCHEYRCAWHLGMLGPRTDRRPDNSGLVFQLEPQPGGRWRVAMYETRPQAGLAENAGYLLQLLLTSKKTRHLSILPDVHLMKFGADLPVAFAISPTYGHESPPPGIPMTRQGQMMVYDGKTRDLLMPTVEVTIHDGARLDAQHDSSIAEAV